MADVPASSERKTALDQEFNNRCYDFSVIELSVCSWIWLLHSDETATPAEAGVHADVRGTVYRCIVWTIMVTADGRAGSPDI